MNRLKLQPIVVVLATVVHLLPLPFGVSPVGALALYSGACGPRYGFWLTPLLPLLLGNLIFGFYEPLVLVFVYAGFALSALTGRFLLRRKRTHLRKGVAVGAGAVVFFAVSNFAVWLAGMYAPTVSGLYSCYLNGLPYLGQAVIIDGLFVFAMFALHDRLVARRAAIGEKVIPA